MGLRRPEHHQASDLGHRLGYFQPATEKVDSAHPQVRQLPEAQPAVSQHQHNQPVRTGRVGQLRDLVVVEEALVGPAQPR
jgi:hypothetical protein